MGGYGIRRKGNKMKIWLDDIRNPPRDWRWAKNADDLFAILFNDEGEMTTDISFDHDLGETEFTGYEILNIIESMIRQGDWPNNCAIPMFHIHSANPVGRRNMERAIDAINSFVR